MKIFKIENVWDAVTKWCLYAAVFLTPLIFLPWTLYPLSLNKQFVFITLLMLALVSWFIKSITKGELVCARSHLSLIVFVLVIFTIFSAWFSGGRTVSFMGANGGEVDTFMAIFGFGLLYFLLASTLRSEKEIKKVFNLFLVSAAIVLIYSFLQMLGWHLLPFLITKNAAFNPIGTTNALGVFLGLIFVMTIALFHRGGDELGASTKGALGLFSAALFITLFLIGYWPVFVGLILATIVLVVVNIKSNKFLLPFSILAISVFILLVNVGFIRFRLPIFNLPGEITPSLSASWKIATNTLQDGAKNFVLGSGPATYQYQYGLFRDTSLNATPFWNLRFAQGYNTFMTHLVNWGFLGTLLFALFLILILATVVGMLGRGTHSLTVSAIEIGLLYLVLMFFFYPQNFVLYFALFMLIGLLVGSVAADHNHYQIFSLVGSPQKTFIFSLVMMVLIMLATSLLYINSQRYLGAIYFARGAAIANTTGDIDQATPHLLSGLDLDPKNDTYLQTLATAFLVKVSNILNNPEISPTDLQTEFSRNVGAAIETARQSVQVNSLNSLNWLGLARVYESVILLVPGAADQAFAAYAETAKLEPNNPLIYSGLGRAHLAASDRYAQEISAVSGDNVKAKELKEKRDEEYSEAIANFDKALSLKSDYAPAHFSLVQVFDRQGKTEEAITRAEKLRVSVLADGDPSNDVGILFQLGLLHYQANRLNKAREMLEGAIELSPDYSNARYFLGLIYDRQGEISNAVEQFEKIAKLNSDNQEVKKIISNLRSGRSALSGIAGGEAQDRRRAPIEERNQEVIPTPAPAPAPASSKE